MNRIFPMNQIARMEKTRDAELEYLKLKLKRWEQKFVAKYERDPGPTDISKYPEVGGLLSCFTETQLTRLLSIAKVYRSYHQLKEAHKRQQKLEMSLALKQQDDDAKALWKQQRTKKKEPLVPSTLENASSSSRVRRDRTLTPPMMFQTPPVEQTEEYDDEVIPPTPVKAHATFDLGLMDAREDDEEEAYGDLTMGTDNLLAPIQEEENSEKSSVPAQVEIFSRDLDSEEPISASCPPGLQRTSRCIHCMRVLQ